MPIKNIIFLIVFIASVSIFIYSIRKIIIYLLVGKKQDNRSGNLNFRLKRVWQVAFIQTKLLRDPVAGTLHLIIFWGFVLFLSAVIESIVQGFYSSFNLSFLGLYYSLITFVQDLFGVLIIGAVIFALYRRFVLKIPRLMVDEHGQKDAVLILLMIIGVCIAMFGQNISSAVIQNFNPYNFEYRPLSYFLAGMFSPGDVTIAEVFYEIFWWLHLLIVFTFMNFLPYSKHFHVISSIPNTFLANIDSIRNTIKPINLEDESIEVFGAADIEQLSWKQILDAYSCTECGRCTDSCPAAIAGKSLSPRKIIVDIRQRTKEKAPLLIEGKTEDKVFEKTLVHDYISDMELWECTTCMACVQECPVMIEHVDSIIDLRRNLVLTESIFPTNLNNVFKSLETNFSPWAFNQSDRANWAYGMNIKTMIDDPNGEILFWVGCAGSFDERYKKVTKSFATIMQKANIDFRILGTEEKCNGDTARRLGNEYIAQMMMKENIETLNNYGVKKIVTACPHCFHSLKNEYKQFGGNFEVVHHSQMIEQLVSSGKIELKSSSEKINATYHDSCYLGRYNGIYNSPRSSLSKIEGLTIAEMNRNKSKGLCCGAGGGRMFLEDEEGGRINVERTKEALSTNPDTIASACPFCMTMLTDGVKHFEKADEVSVKDIAEIILENSK